MQEGAKQVVFGGMDGPISDKTPDFAKALDIDHARDGEVMLAYSMNGQDLPVLNGFPLRLIVPGYYGTYWVKHLNEITVLDNTFDGFWMKTAYRIPDNDCACVEPGTTPKATIPINRFNVRSFITNLTNGAKVKAGASTLVKGIAFDSGKGIKEVSVSTDDGGTWLDTKLGKDLGKYSFREWDVLHQAAARIAQPKGSSHEHGGPDPADGSAMESGGIYAQRDRNNFRHRSLRGQVMTATRMTSCVAALAVTTFIFGSAAIQAKPISYDLPEETAAFRPGPNLEAAQNNCTSCHSVDYIQTQPEGPKFKREFWHAEVTKMIKVYGAPIEDADVDKIVEYLTQAN